MHFFHTKTEIRCVFYAHTSSQLPRFKCPRATWGWWHPCGCSPLLRNQDPGPTAPFIQAGYLKPLCSALCMSYYLTKSSQLCRGEWYEEEADGQQGKWVSHMVTQHVRGRAGWNPLPHAPSLQHPHPLTPAYPGLCWAGSGETQGHITAIPAHKKLLAQPSQVRSYAEACCIAPCILPLTLFHWTLIKPYEVMSLSSFPKWGSWDSRVFKSQKPHRWEVAVLALSPENVIPGTMLHCLKYTHSLKPSCT